MKCLQFTITAILLNLGVGLASYINPIVDSNHPDPGVLRLPTGEYVAVTTSNLNQEGNLFPILFSKDLITWEERGHVFKQNEWPTWAFQDFWAPEIHLVDGRYQVYFSARQSENNQLAIGVAISQESVNPFGPYLDLGRPIIQGEPGVIDIHYTRDPTNNEKPYLVWKTDDNALNQPSKIYIQEVENNGIDFVPGSVATIIMEATEPEDVNVVEGPSIFYQEPYFYLLFSGDVYLSPYYHTVVARSFKIQGPYERAPSDRTFLHTDLEKFENGEDCTFVGPGHGSPVISPTNRWVYVYHTWRYGLVDTYPPGRVMNLDPMKFDENMWPIVGVPSDTEQLDP